MRKLLHSPALGQYCETGKVGLCSSPSTPLNAKLYSHSRAIILHLVPGECYSLPAVIIETPADNNSLHIPANRGPSGRYILIGVF